MTQKTIAQQIQGTLEYHEQGTTTQRIRRTPEQRREHYEIERALADRLRYASKEERKELYASVYNELFQRVAHHPQLLLKQDAARRDRIVADQLRLLRPFLKPGQTFLEIGAGDCRLSFAVARLVRQVYAVDVSQEIVRSHEVPENFALILSDGTSVPVPPESVDLAYSNQLMEHLHPEDAVAQLQQIYAALAPGGRYLCITPNRLSGPHDVSRFFDEEATCLHLKEYTSGELADLMRSAGFRRVYTVLSLGHRQLPVPLAAVRLIELALGLLPYKLRRRIGRGLPVRKFLGKVIAEK